MDVVEGGGVEGPVLGAVLDFAGWWQSDAVLRCGWVGLGGVKGFDGAVTYNFRLGGIQLGLRGGDVGSGDLCLGELVCKVTVWRLVGGYATPCTFRDGTYIAQMPEPVPTSRAR